MPADRRKPRPKPLPYNRKPRKQPEKDAPVTAAKIKSKATRENLSLHDWLTIFAYIDKHPGVSQGDIVGHFASKADGSLHFTQSTLSRKLKMRQQLEEQVHDNPNALSAKRRRIVTRPDVEEALVKWVQQMENKNEHVTGAMLQEKRLRFENLLEVPEEERLTGEGWVTNPFPNIALTDAIAMCEKLEKACITLGYADGDVGLTLPQELRHFRGYLRQRESRNAKQITLTELWRK